MIPDPVTPYSSHVLLILLNQVVLVPMHFSRLRLVRWIECKPHVEYYVA